MLTINDLINPNGEEKEISTYELKATLDTRPEDDPSKDEMEQIFHL
jgi:hypothetical protein